ncbi:hypothetical protein ACFVTM_06580 [Arthrobacter sp. NPDC058130]|uniref:hypothetical protein n=1 Tax=Arthrobacter sp. NPDC058130 TaxID=3346353 RepID=UPI0036EB28E1
MSLEDAVNGQESAAARSDEAPRAAHEAVPGIYESARSAAAARMERTLGHASKRLIKGSVPTSLAVITTGTDWTAWHFVAQSLGWPLESEIHGTAFLTIDGRICFYRQSTTFGGDEFLSVDTVLSTFEGGSAVKKLVNPRGMVPPSGRVISLPSRKPGKEPAWMVAPQRLIEFSDNQAIARWPRTALDNLVNIDFDRKGKVWVTYPQWDHRQSIPLKEWLTITAANLVTPG